MTDFVSSPVSHRVLSPSARTDRWLAPLYALALAAGAAGVAIGMRAGDASAIDGHLALLLRFMAALKALTAFGALGLLHWRLRAPIATAPALGYLAALAPMMLAPGLIWSLAHVAPGAICFHAGLFGFLILALRDDAVGRGRLARRR